MPEYLSPGVYVEEIPSAVKPIAGVSTSTACFLGIVPDEITVPVENPDFDPTGKSKPDPKPDPNKPEKPDPRKPFLEPKFKFFSADDIKVKVTATKAAKAALDANNDPAQRRKLLEGLTKAENDEESAKLPAQNMEPVLCTSFSEFKKHFGDFSTDGLGESSKDVNAFTGNKGLQNRLAHAVFGFFDNGGTRCCVMRFRTGAELLQADHLDVLEPIDEISIVAAPGITDPTVQKNLVDHCTKLKSRFAILDPPELPESCDLTADTVQVIGNSDYAALYFPRIRVFDIASDLTKPDPGHEVNGGKIWIGPSGHMAGIYSQVDHERGVHKAPANVVMRDALDVEFDISRNRQDGLNPEGINCIRRMNKNITVWGARTIGGDANTDLKYINVRRTLIFLRESIDRGTQWVVFEPNDRTLWAKIRLNVSAFLTTVWRDGALFGSTPQEAFYVKCDDETNPREERDLGKVTTEIGVAIVKPAEFVIFRISQWAGPEQK